MKNNFKILQEFFQQQTCQQSCHIPEDIQWIRSLHLKLCRALDTIDKDLAYLYGKMFVWNVGLGLFIAYNLITGQHDTFSMIAKLYWIATTFGFLAVMCVFAATVNKAAHEPLETIHYINVKDITVEKLAQLNLFLSRLTGTQIGFTACGLLTITKEFILTIAGVFLTYFFVLYTL